MRILIFYISTLLLTIFSGKAGYCQTYKWVNTNHVIVRDCLDYNYIVLIILNKQCKVTIDKYDREYATNKTITSKFYRVAMSYKDQNNKNHSVGGWIMKKYLSDSVLVKDFNNGKQSKYEEVPLISYSGTRENNPNKQNRFAYPYPKYKGGEPILKKAPTKKYFSGPNGGCYYLSKTGKKIYVDKKYCNKTIRN